MNAAHLHLLLNHAPLFLALGGGLFAGAGALMREAWLRRAGLALLVIAGLLVWPLMESGEGAEEVLESAGRLSEPLLHAHEEAAEISVPLFALAAVAAALGLILDRKPAVRVVALFAAACGFAAFALAARAANLGGRISHPEIRPGGEIIASAPTDSAVASAPAGEHEKERD